MKIIFNRLFDEGYYADPGDDRYRHMYNRTIIGPRGLLSLLEQETGLQGKYLSATDRTLAYSAILEGFIRDNPDAFFAASFRVDPAGVSRELLRWRDQLVLAGWHSEVQGVSDRLNTLARIDAVATVPLGFEDRWKTVLDKITGVPEGTLTVKSIEVHGKREWLHPFYLQLLNQLTEKRIAISYENIGTDTSSEGNLGKLKEALSKPKAGKIMLNPDDKKSLLLLEFGDEATAGEFICSQSALCSSSVIINRNSLTLSLVQETFGQRRSGAEIKATQPQVLQIMNLATSLFISPVNIYNLISYLQIPIHPLPDGVRNNLLRVIGDNGGVPGDKWEEALSDYPAEGKRKKEISLFSGLWKCDNDKIDRERIILFYESLRRWAIMRKKAGEDEPELQKRELGELHASCKRLVSELWKINDDNVALSELKLLISRITEPANVRLFREERNSVESIENPAQMISPADNLIWLSFCNGEIGPGFYDFLNDTEYLSLEKTGLSLWSREAQAEAILDELRQAVWQARKRLILVRTDREDDEDTGDHPLLSLMKARVDNLEEIAIRPERSWEQTDYEKYGFTLPAMIACERSLLPEKKAVHNITNGNIVRLRETESFSSLEKITNYPFDWVFEYCAEIKPGKVLEPAEINTLQGKVAHHFIQTLFTRAEKNLMAARSLLQNHYESMLYEAAESFGAQLLLEQHRFEYMILSTRLRTSAEILINLIEANNLRVYEMEMETEGNARILNGLNILAYIDLLLVGDDGNYVLLDLKWSRKADKFRKMIDEGRAVQLSLYMALLAEQGKNVVKMGFFTLTGGMLITAFNFAGDEAHIIHIDNADSWQTTLERLENSVNFRMRQIEAGDIEEAEEFKKEALDYYMQQDVQNLLRINDYMGKKGKNYYSNLSALKGNIK